MLVGMEPLSTDLLCLSGLIQSGPELVAVTL